MIRLIATDMDGTLLNSKNQLPDGFYQILHRLVNKGVYFAIASGRQYQTLQNNFSLVKEQLIFIAENGAIVMQNDRELFSCGMDKKDVADIISDVRKLEDCDIVLCGKRSAYVETLNPDFEAEVRKYYHSCEKVQDLLEIEDDILKVAVYDYVGSEEHSYKVLYPKWGRTANVIVSGKHWMDFGRPDTDKGTALKHLKKVLDVTDMETLVFGDYFNDVPMMECAYYSYAMENAPQGVKSKARFIAPSNTEDGVLKVICSLEKEGLI